MRFLIAGSRLGLTHWLRFTIVLGMAAAGIVSLNLAGCPQPTYHQMFPGVTLNQILKITDDSTLTTDQKTQALKDLGISDDQVIYFLENAPLSSATQPTK